MTNKPITENLHKVLADSYALYIKTHNYHWNIEGMQFKPLHELFEEHYTELATAIDEVAERIRILGEKVPASFSVFAKLTSIQDGNEDADAETMVKELVDGQNIVINSLKDTLEVAQDAEDEVTIGLVVDRITVHEKNAWMLRSHLA